MGNTLLYFLVATVLGAVGGLIGWWIGDSSSNKEFSQMLQSYSKLSDDYCSLIDTNIKIMEENIQLMQEWLSRYELDNDIDSPVVKPLSDMSDLIVDMTMKGANEKDLEKAINHSKVVIDMVESEKKNDIEVLTKKFQG